MNTLAEIAKQSFLAKALNNPKECHPKRRVELRRRVAKIIEHRLFNAEDLKTLGEPWRAA